MDQQRSSFLPHGAAFSRLIVFSDPHPLPITDHLDDLVSSKWSDKSEATGMSRSAVTYSRFPYNRICPPIFKSSNVVDPPLQAEEGNRP
jgi:hypothetical protein